MRKILSILFILLLIDSPAFAVIKTSNGNIYTMQGVHIDSVHGKALVSYQVSNNSVIALGFPAKNIVFDVTPMPAVQAAFANPATNGLPLFPAFEAWLIGDHSTDIPNPQYNAQNNPNASQYLVSPLQVLTGGTILSPSR